MRRLRNGTLGLLSALVLVGATSTPPSDSPVADAAQQGDAEQVRALVTSGADVNAAQGDGMTALHWAAFHGHPAIAEVLLYAGAHVDPRTRLGGYTPLHLSAQKGHGEVTVRLLEAGADAEAVTETGVRPLHLAAEADDPASVRALLAHRADPDVTDLHARRTPLMFATAAGATRTMAELIGFGADIHAETRVIDYAARSDDDMKERRQREMLMAIRRGEDPAEAARRGLGPYRQAAPAQPDTTPPDSTTTAPDAEVQEKAADKPGADVARKPGATPTAGAPGEPKAEKAATPKAEEAANPKAEPDEPEPQPLGYSDLVGRQGGLTALHYAARDGRRAEAMMLLEAGADLNGVTAGDHSTPLVMAILNGHYDLALEFLSMGADATVATEDGATPLFLAVQSRWAHRTWYPQPTAWRQQQADHLELMRALLEAGADPNVRLSTHLWYVAYNAGRIGVDFSGATPFWRAAYSLDVDAMRLLVEYGADPNIRTIKPPERRFRRAADGEEEEADPSGLPPVPVGGPSLHALHAATGAGYGTSRVGQQHVYRPDGWLPAVRYLVEELGVDVNVRDHEGYSPMHNAAARGDNEVLRFLYEHGGDPMVVSRRGQTTVDMANGPQQRVQPFPETIALLEGWGAKNNNKCQSC